MYFRLVSSFHHRFSEERPAPDAAGHESKHAALSQNLAQTGDKNDVKTSADEYYGKFTGFDGSYAELGEQLSIEDLVPCTVQLDTATDPIFLIKSEHEDVASGFGCSDFPYTAGNMYKVKTTPRGEFALAFDPSRHELPPGSTDRIKVDWRLLQGERMAVESFQRIALHFLCKSSYAKE
jgi:hypothetical protein